MFVFKIKNFLKYSSCLLTFIVSHNLSASESEACLNFHVIHSEPHGYIDKGGAPKGIHWEYLEAIREHSGLCINFSLFPYARIWESIKNGRHDGGIIFKSKTRTNLVEYAGHIQTTPTVVIPLKNINLETYSDLNNLRIGNIRGAHLSNKFDNDKALNIIQLVNYEQGARMIKLKRLDAVSGNEYALKYQLKKHKVLDKVDVNNQFKLGEKEQWLQLSKSSQHLDKLPSLQKSITALKKSGVFHKISLKYNVHLVSLNN